jgi:hypothetical protein
LRALVGVMAVAIVVAVIWAASPLAGGGSSDSSNSETTEDPAAAFVQDGRGSGAEDCPEREEEGEDSSADL